MNSRNGKIARLPHYIRHQLNQRLEASERGPRLLRWLNSLPEARDILESDFDGVPISPQNLSQWRRGGFQEWLATRQIACQFGQLEDLSQEIAADRLGVPADAVATFLSIRLGALAVQWPNRSDKAKDAQLQALDRFSRVTDRLQKCARSAKKEDEARVRRIEEEVREANERRKQRLLDQVTHMNEQNALEMLWGETEVAKIIARYVTRIKSDDPHPELALAELPAALARADQAREEKAEKRRQRAEARRREEEEEEAELDEAEEEGPNPAEQPESPQKSQQIKPDQSSSPSAKSTEPSDRSVGSDRSVRSDESAASPQQKIE